MQRYGWQARQAQSAQSQSNTPSTNPNKQSQNKSQVSDISSKILKSNEQDSKSKQSSSIMTPSPRTKITRVSSIDPNPLFQGIDLIPGIKRPNKVQQSINAKKGGQSQTAKESSQLSETKRGFVRTQQSNTRGRAFDATSKTSSIKTQSEREPVPQLNFQVTQEQAQKMQKQYLTQRQTKAQSMTYQSSNVEPVPSDHVKNEQTQNPRNNTARRPMATERKKYDMFDDILMPKPKSSSRNQQTGQSSDQVPEKRKQVIVQTKILNQVAPQPTQEVVTSSFQIGIKAKSNILLFCLQKLVNAKKCTRFNEFKKGLGLKSVNSFRKGCATIMISLFRKKIEEINGIFFIKLLKISSEFKLVQSKPQKSGIKVGNYMAMAIRSLFNSKIRASYGVIKSFKKEKSPNQLLKTIERFYNKNIRLGFVKMKQNSKQSSLSSLINLSSLLCRIYKNKISACYLKIIRIKKSKLQQSPLQIQNELRVESPKVSKQSSGSSPNITFSESKKKPIIQNNLHSRKTGLDSDAHNMKLTKLLQVAKKDHSKQLQNSQLRVEELKQIISEYNFQLDFKKLKIKQLQLISKELPQENTGTVSNPSQPAQTSGLSNLLKIYNAVIHNPNENIQITQLSLLNQSQTITDPASQCWTLLHQNLLYKKQIQNQQKKLINNQNENIQGICDLGKNNASWQYAYQEHIVMTNLVRNFIKEQYYWAIVRKIVAR